MEHGLSEGERLRPLEDTFSFFFFPLFVICPSFAPFFFRFLFFVWDSEDGEVFHLPFLCF